MTLLLEDLKYNNSVPGWLGSGDMKRLYELAGALEPGSTIVEVGSMHGKSACCMASAASTSNIYCYDFWPGNNIKASDEIIRLNTMERFSEYTERYSNITPIRVKSNLDYEWTGPAVDLFFIDAAHTNPTDWQTIEYWLPNIKSGGIICGHDYYTKERDGIIRYPDVIENANRLVELLESPLILNEFSSVWAIKVK